jgi:outer membrane immunogenic protein
MAFAFGQTAWAADMPVKARRPVAVGDRWTGWYWGLNIGYGDPDGMDIAPSNSGTGAIGGFGPFNRASNTGAIPTHLDTNPKGFVGGFQAGYNWHVAPQWVIGAEADIDYSDIKGSDSRIGVASAGFPLAVNSTALVSGSQRMDWLGTVRARVGFLPFQNLLLYGTGGLAYGHVKSSTTISETGCVLIFCTSAAGAGSASSTRAGWAAGAGAEWAINEYWSLKTEYLYADLGKLTYTNGPVSFAPFGSIVNTTTTAHFNNQMVRIGFNHRF